MKTVKEKIAYLRGVIDGDSSLKEDRMRFLFKEVLQILGELADDVNQVEQIQAELDDYLQEIDFDLAHLEDELAQVEPDQYDDPLEWDAWDDETGSLVEIQCPQCGYSITFDEDLLCEPEVQIRCPRCDAGVFEIDDYQEGDQYFIPDDLEDLEQEDEE